MKISAIAVIRAVLAAITLLRSQGLNQRAIHGEVPIAHKLLRMAIHFCKEKLCHFGVQQAITVLRKRRMVPDDIVRAEANEPAEQQVVVDLFDQ